MAVPQSALRISMLPNASSQQIDGLLNPDGVDAGAWVLGVDSIRRQTPAQGTDQITGSDEGTIHIPMTYIAMRDSNGYIPAHMLPSYVDDMMFGTLAITSSSATFTENMPSGGTPHVYVSPTTTGYPLPPQNVIFCDTTSNIQYRFTGETSTDVGVNHFGFTEVPGSRAINAGYGIEITNANDANMTISAKKADYFTSYATSNAVTVTSTASNIPISSTSEKSVLDAVIESDRLTKVTGLVPGSRYAMNLQLECTPTALSANVIDVSVTGGTVPVMKKQMDMSGPTTSAVTRLDYFCEFTYNSSELTVKIAADESISVKTTRFTIFELL